MKLYLGCGPGSIHQQHRDIMGDVSEWTLVDKYVKRNDIENWDAEVLSEVKDGTVDKIYASHLLEHFSHRKVPAIIEMWGNKLKKGGELILNVPDMEWACMWFLLTLQAEREGKPVSRAYYRYTINHSDHEHDFLQIFYGSHENDGEYHKCGFTKESMTNLLKDFSEVKIDQVVEAHEMGCLIVRAVK